VPVERVGRKVLAAPFALYRSLRAGQSSPFMFYFNFRDFHVVGASPESCPVFGDEIRSVRRGQPAVVVPRQRGPTPSRRLLADEKSLAETDAALDLGRNDVAASAKIATVRQRRIHRRTL